MQNDIRSKAVFVGLAFLALAVYPLMAGNFGVANAERLGQVDGLGLVGQQRLGQPAEIPMRHLRLIGIGIAAAIIDRTQHHRRVIAIHEGAGAVIDRLARNGHIIGVHHAMDETHQHPPRD